MTDLAISNASDEGLSYVGELRHLETLTLYKPKFTEAGLFHLKKLKNLEVYPASEDDVEKWQELLPHCTIRAWEKEDFISTPNAPK